MSMTPCCADCKRLAPAVSLNMRSVLGNFYLICEPCEARQQGKAIRYSDSSVIRQPGTVPAITARPAAASGDTLAVSGIGDVTAAEKLQNMLTARAASAGEDANLVSLFTPSMTPIERHMAFRVAIGKPALHVGEPEVAEALESLIMHAIDALRHLANNEKSPDGGLFDAAEISQLARRLNNAHQSTIRPLVLLVREVKASVSLSEDCAAPIPAVFSWCDDWQENGWNGCLLSAKAALTYLVDNERPSYGSSRFNSEHLLDISNALSRTWDNFLAPVITCFGFAGDVGALLGEDRYSTAAARTALAKLLAGGVVNLAALSTRADAIDDAMPCGRVAV